MRKPLACLLGSAPALAKTEIETILGLSAQLQGEHFCIFPQAEIDDLPALQNRLGGTVKLVTLEKQIADNTTETCTQAIVEYLVGLNLPKLNFGIGEWGRDHLPVLSIYPVKQQLQAQGIKVRFQEDSRLGLSTALLSHREVTEVIILAWNDQTWLGQTRTTSDPDEWSTRDRGKPYAEHSKGLLPPKVARMMVNLALGRMSITDSTAGNILYDPFCGSGTVLMEARTLGLSVYGSDLDATAISGTRQNLDWQSAREGLTIDSPLQTADVSKATWPSKVHYVVTEPFLGKPKPRPEDLPGMFRGLEKLYWGAFRHWTSILEEGAEVVIVFPAVQEGTTRFSLKSLIDKVNQLGYTIVSGPWHYHRPGAIVEREIYHFKYVTR